MSGSNNTHISGNRRTPGYQQQGTSNWPRGPIIRVQQNYGSSQHCYPTTGFVVPHAYPMLTRFSSSVYLGIRHIYGVCASPLPVSMGLTYDRRQYFAPTQYHFSATPNANAIPSILKSTIGHQVNQRGSSLKKQFERKSFIPRRTQDSKNTLETFNVSPSKPSRATLDSISCDRIKQHLKTCNDDMLFFTFYNLTQDQLQVFAASVLFSRGWRYHVEYRIWMSHNPNAVYTPLTYPGPNTSFVERGKYKWFDVATWTVKHTEMICDFSKLDFQPKLEPKII